jgi:putative inorganic carbon (HCO3(-)) transporter
VSAIARTPQVRPGAWAEQLAWWAAAIGASALVSYLTMRSLQLGCTFALLVLAVGAYVRSRTAGLAVMWAVWLLTPLVRRLFGLEGGYISADPLAVAPFLVTGVLVAVELRRTGLPQPLRRPLLLAGVGLLIGIPAALGTPAALGFALFSYGTAVSALVLGYRESAADVASGGSLARSLLLALPFMAIYGIYQYFAIPEWDRVWVETTNFVTAGAPEEGHVRVWSTLNSPGTFGMTLGIGLVYALGSQRFGPVRLAAVAVMIVALALTYLRSAWVALAVAALALLVASRGRYGPRIAVALAIAFVGVPALAGGGTGEAITGRFTSLGDLGGDTSAQERQATTLSLVPQTLSKPLGSGFGSAGEASRLSHPGSDFRYTDNAYLSLLYQVGPFGFLLLAAAAAPGVRRAWRLARRRTSGPVSLALFGVIVFSLVGMFTGDLLFGITGIAFWYVLGMAIGRDEATRT